MAPHHSHVNNEITKISAKFSVNLTNIYKVTNCCLALYDALTTTQATWRQWRHSSLSSTSRMKWPMFCLFLAVFGEFDPLNVVSHRSDPKKAHPCMIASVMSHCASKSIHGSLQ